MDVAAAFDNVPHSYPVRTVQASGVDPYLCRYIEVRLKERIFRLRQTTPDGKYYSGLKPISTGVPQGGILSPFLRLLHVNPFADRVRGALGRRLGEEASKNLRLLLYADDIMCALAQPNMGALATIVWVLADICQSELSLLGLSSEAEKSEGFLIPPNFGEESLFRRHPRRLPASELTPCTRAQAQAAGGHTVRLRASDGSEEGPSFPYRCHPSAFLELCSTTASASRLSWSGSLATQEKTSYPWPSGWILGGFGDQHVTMNR